MTSPGAGQPAEPVPADRDVRPPLRCAVIGAGIAGLAAARVLREAGHRPLVLDKARGPGGRMSTRRVDSGSFDHGAQYFSARDPSFRHEVERWRELGLVATWPLRQIDLKPDGQRERPAPDRQRVVAVPGMSALTSALADAVDMRSGTRIERLALCDSGVRLYDDSRRDLGDFDVVLVTAPLPQTAALLASAQLALPEALATRSMQPCWALLLTTPRCAPGFDAVRLLDDQTLAWCAFDSGKPGRQTRDDVSHFVLHATPQWSSRWLESDADEVAQALTRHAAARLPELPAPLRAVAHRWRYARVAGAPPAVDTHYSFADDRVWLAGDGIAGESRVEAAWLSGTQAALALLSARSAPG